MGRFYENQRKNQNILVKPDGSPQGGKWSFDELNRKKLPKNISIPEMPRLPKNDIAPFLKVFASTPSVARVVSDQV